MGFSEFLGNARVVTALRGMLAGERVPHAMLFTGPRGVGKFTLARMFAQAANCARLRDDLCGECAPVRPKDPVARPVLHVGQLRAIQRAAYFKPQGRRRVFILDGAETMRWDLASIFLKVLEEPPESATLILIAPNPFQLLSTIRSRCLQFSLTPLAAAEVEEILSARTEMKPADRKLAAQLSEGSPGAAMAL